MNLKNYIVISIVFLALSSCGEKKQNAKESDSKEFTELSYNLLKEWCDGMISVQINAPGKPEIHGALDCPACNKIHGRCMDAVYPFMYMAETTGEQKYLDAAISVMDWSKNVTMPDGSWTVIPNPKSWRGITVFGAIALAEALHHHGHLLDDSTRVAWTKRLGDAGDYLYNNFNMTFTNVNYGASSLYAFQLIGHLLDRPEYIEKSREMAKEFKNFLTEPNSLLFGEGKPSTVKSAKGLYAVDLGYNVEESLNNVVLYALMEKDEELLQLLQKSMESHLEFMLPDGAWDNSWGSRQAKWSYWGSRTTDGCQYGFSMMADRNPAFGTAAFLNTELLDRCTEDGFLHGGPHYVSHGVKPCVHHTFAHAKVLASVLNEEDKLPGITKNTAVPRSIAKGVKEFPEIDVWLAAMGPWRGTVSSYDVIYKEHVQGATGGALAVLYHEKVGLLLTSSMAKYLLVEKNNQQPNPGEEFALTPRIETYKNGTWYTNLYDHKAEVSYKETDVSVKFEVKTHLQNEDHEMTSSNDGPYTLNYIFNDDEVQITAQESDRNKLASSLVIPIVSPTGEGVEQVSPTKIKVLKAKGTVLLESNVPMRIKDSEKGRIFNMVPGVEVVPVIVDFPKDSKDKVIVSLKVI